MSSLAGKLITIEGIEGAGKSTQAVFTREYLAAAGRPVILTREPGGTALGEEIRALLLNHRQDAMSADSELLLIFAARAEHIQRVIQPALEKGDWVICDRFTDATYAYQGGGRGVPCNRIADLEKWVQGDLRPNLTLLLDVPVAEGLARASRRGANDRFESEDEAFFERVQRTYLDLAASDPQRYRIIAANRPIAEVRTAVEHALETLLVE